MTQGQPTPRQAEAINAALMLGTTSPTKLAKALGIHPSSAMRLARKCNAAGALAAEQEKQRDKTRGLTTVGRRLASSLADEDFSGYDAAQKVVLLRQLVEILPKQQECGLIEEIDNAPAAVQQRVELRRLRALQVGVRAARRFGEQRVLEVVRARLQAIMCKPITTT
jgi:DNA-binding MarR family transcriptional regulator